MRPSRVPQTASYRAGLPERPTIGERCFIVTSYCIKHKASKNGSVVVLRGYRYFDKKTGAGEPAHILLIKRDMGT